MQLTIIHFAGTSRCSMEISIFQNLGSDDSETVLGEDCMD